MGGVDHQRGRDLARRRCGATWRFASSRFHAEVDCARLRSSAPLAEAAVETALISSQRSLSSSGPKGQDGPGKLFYLKAVQHCEGR